RTTILPSRKRASATVSRGIAARSSGIGVVKSQLSFGLRCYSHASRDDWIIVTQPGSFKPHSIALPVAALIVAMASIQLGAVFAKSLFPKVGASGTAALRLALASLILLAVWRPWRVRPTARELRSIVIYGLAMGWMNFFFYLSLSRIPLGIAVALEFTGPLAVAMAASHRAVDFLWI